jgi:hypothetical protein
MRKPRLTLAWLMALVALVALNFAAVRAWLSYRVGHGVGADGRQMTYVENTYDLMGYGGLPMADVLAVGLLAGIIGVRWRPFILGFMVFGLIALVAFVACAALYTEGVIQPRILWVLRSLPRDIYGLSPAVRTPILYAIAACLVVLPQLALAMLGGFLFQVLSRRTRYG